MKLFQFALKIIYPPNLPIRSKLIGSVVHMQQVQAVLWLLQTK